MKKSGIRVLKLARSLIPHFWKYADLTGASPLIEKENFVAKAGGITVWNGKINRIAFSEFGFSRPALHVERDIFDELLLKHAESQGALIFQEVTVRQANLDLARPRIVYIDRRGDELREGVVDCRFVVDASGPSAFLAGQFKSRRLINSRMRFLSLWGYFKNSRFVAGDGYSHAAADIVSIRPVTFVTSFAEGWIWHIALRDTASVGLVINTDSARNMDKTERERFFLDTLRNAPYLNRLLADAVYEAGSFSERPDYSYYSSTVCGGNFYCIGDAVSFVDPIFSHGVLNAFYNAVMTAFAVRESLKDPQRCVRHAQLCENRIKQFYGFSRSLALGEFGGDGVEPELVRGLMRQLPPNELDLMLAAACISDRSENFHRLAGEAGIMLNRASVGAHIMQELFV